MPAKRAHGAMKPIASKDQPRVKPLGPQQTGMGNWNEQLTPRVKPGADRKAALALVNAGLRAGASKEDIKEAVLMLGVATPTGIMVNREV